MQRQEYACIQIIIIQYDHENLKQVNMVMNETTTKKLGINLIKHLKSSCMHAHHDVFLPFLIVTSVRTRGIPTNHINIQNNQD